MVLVRQPLARGTQLWEGIWQSPKSLQYSITNTNITTTHTKILVYDDIVILHAVGEIKLHQLSPTDFTHPGWVKSVGPNAARHAICYIICNGKQRYVPITPLFAIQNRAPNFQKHVAGTLSVFGSRSLPPQRRPFHGSSPPAD